MPLFKYLSDEEMRMGLTSAPAKLAASIGRAFKHGAGPLDKLKLIYLYFSLQLHVRMKLGFFLPFFATVRSTSGKKSRLYFQKADNFWAFDEIYMLEIYLPRYRGNEAVIFDLGANAGYASAYFAACYPDAKIYAVEPILTIWFRVSTNTGKSTFSYFKMVYLKITT